MLTKSFVLLGLDKHLVFAPKLVLTRPAQGLKGARDDQL